MILNTLFFGVWRRQSSSSIPSTCYDDCNNAMLEGQQQGKSPSLCESKSPFSQSVGYCQACIEAKNGNSTGTTVELEKTFQQFLNYCANVTGTNETLVVKIASYQSAISSFSAVSASLASDAASLGFTSTATDSTTTQLSSARLTSSIPLTASLPLPPKFSSSPTSAVSSSSKGTGEVAGAAVGSIVGVAATLLAVGYFVRRKRRTRRRDAEFVGLEKPMLHSDDLKPDRNELPGDMPAPKVTSTLWNNSKAEMPVNETPGTELDASNAQDGGPTGGHATR